MQHIALYALSFLGLACVATVIFMRGVARGKDADFDSGA